MLTIEGLAKEYPPRFRLSDFSATVPGGEVAALVGPNGSGKSTLMHLLTGLIRADAGTAHIGAAQLGSKLYRKALAFCPDDLPSADYLTGAEYLDLVCSVRAMAPHRDAIALIADGLGIGDALDSLIGAFSHGMRRKLQLLASLLGRPQVLILDEPFRGLDPYSTVLLKEFVRRLARDGCAVVFSSHDLLVAEQMSTLTLVIENGSLRAYGRTSDLIERSDAANMEQMYMRLTGLEEDIHERMEMFSRGYEMLRE
jgi:ABC-2 type transport system ATP-binding protein